MLRPATGAEVEAQVAKVASTPKPVLEEAARVLEEQYRQLRPALVISASNHVVALPALILPLLPSGPGMALALCAHLLGAFAARWLFFAEAEHVVGLYYGRR